MTEKTETSLIRSGKILFALAASVLFLKYGPPTLKTARERPQAPQAPVSNPVKTNNIHGLQRLNYQ